MLHLQHRERPSKQLFMGAELLPHPAAAMLKRTLGFNQNIPALLEIVRAGSENAEASTFYFYFYFSV